jgi:hypothetical protein
MKGSHHPYAITVKKSIGIFTQLLGTKRTKLGTNKSGFKEQKN